MLQMPNKNIWRTTEWVSFEMKKSRHEQVYDSKQQVDWMFISRFMDQAVQVLSVAAQGLRTNFWGLGCPAFCGQFPLSAFLCSFLIGWLLGIATSFWIFWTLQPLLQPPSGPAGSFLSSAASQRLAGYLHERQLLPRRRH